MCDYVSVLNSDTINSVKAIITSNTVADAEVILYIIDSTEFNTGNFGNAIFTSVILSYSKRCC